MSKKHDFIWKAIQVVCWFIFAGLCVQTGALLFNYMYSLFRPIATYNLHLGLDLSALYNSNKVLYSVLFAIILALSAFKAYVFFIVLTLFKKLNLVKPFSEEVSALVSRITYVGFAIGLTSLGAHRLVEGLVSRGYDVGVVERYWNDGGAYLMMSAILFVISLIFRKGIELQNDNELTI